MNATTVSCPCPGYRWDRDSPEDKQTNFFENIDGPTMMNGQTIHQWDFHGYGSQKWIIEHHGNGYYAFRTAYTADPYYLTWSGDSTSGTNYPVVLNYFSSVNDVILWRIFPNSDGTFHFIPKGGEEMMYCLAAETNSTNNGVRLMQSLLYSGQDIEKWILLKKPYEIDVNIYFDNAFKNLYANGSDSMAEALLRQSYDVLSSVFELTFGIKLNFNAIPYRSLADTCTNDNPYGICPENPYLKGNSGTCSCHPEGDNCTSRGATYDHFIQEHPGSRNSVSVLVSGHIFYDKDGNFCNRSFKSGYGIIIQLEYVYYKNFPSRTWLNQEKVPSITWDNGYTRFCYIMLHELSHFIGAPDHYCEIDKVTKECLHKELCDDETHNNDETKRRDGWCAMDNDGSDKDEWDSVSERFQQFPHKIFCIPCYQDILNYLITYLQ